MAQLSYDEKLAVIHIAEHLLSGMVGIRGFDMNLLNLMSGNDVIRFIGRQPTHIMLSSLLKEELMEIIQQGVDDG